MSLVPLASLTAHLRLAQDPLAGLARGLAEGGGDAVAFRLPQGRLVALGAPRAIDRLLHERAPRVRKSVVIRAMAEAVGDGLLTTDDDRALAERRTIAPLLTPRHVARWVDEMAEIALRRVPEGEVDLLPVTSATALDVVARTLFGEPDGLDAARIALGIERWMEAHLRDVNSWRRLLPEALRPHRRVRQEVAAELRHVLLALVERRRRRGIAGDDVLGRLLAAEAASGERMSDDAAHAALATLFVAGHETTALALAYAGWLLSRHPEAQAALRDECLRRPLPRGPQDLAARPVLSAVIDETLRLFPPAFGVGREALVDLDLDGIAVPAGATVVASFLHAHRDLRWWRAPEQFRPERWWNGEAEGLPRGAFLPFGAGPRVCVGAHFARLELAVVLATWVAAVELHPAGPDALPLRASVTLRPAGPVRVRCEPRARARVDAFAAGA